MVKEETLDSKVDEDENEELDDEDEVVEEDEEDSEEMPTVGKVIGDLNFGSGSGEMFHMPIEGVSSTLEDVARVVEDSGLSGFIPVQRGFDSEEKEDDKKKTSEPVYFSEKKYMEQDKLYDDFSSGEDMENIKNTEIGELGRADDFSERANKQVRGEMKSLGEHNIKETYTHARSIKKADIQNLGREKKDAFESSDVKLDYTF